MSHIDIKKLAKNIAVPLAVGGVSSLLTMGAMKTFGALKQPILSPPGWLFPVVWTSLYTLMGISTYILDKTDSTDSASSRAKSAYFYQLVFNFLWSIFFFNMGWYLFSFIWLIGLWLLIVWMIKEFLGIAKISGWLNVPYLLWVTFAAYLNFGVWWLNR